ncbi:glutamine-hydrolyzing GMP synthase [Patescibacteria group bacterium]|nr:MAG: glutamine-hydrolyzing GMP synthase [Patescibacteria group bacterium]
MPKSEIAILDFGSQYTHLIARRVRELGVISRIYPNNVKAERLKNACGIILSGGPRSLVRDARLPFDKKIFTLSAPILGLCYGHQLMADFFGGRVESGKAREYGLAKLSVSASPIFSGVSKNTVVWMSHGDHVDKLPFGFTPIASTGNRSVAAMQNLSKKFFGFQFHPEVNHTKEGKKILANFILNICGAEKNWTTETMLDQIEKNIKKEAGGKNVFLLVSGGVDSTVCFALLRKVLGEKRVFGLHIDSGLMRLDETKKIIAALKRLGDNLRVYNAEKEFLSALKGVSDPEQKRKIIGDLFLDIVDKVMAEPAKGGSGRKKLTGDKWLVGQGTIYPDTIESGGTKNADVIKTHHNRVPRIKQMIAEGKIIEPIKDLYKDEVRAIGLKLGLPQKLINRHPFPGPGLAIRCLCSEGSNDAGSIVPDLVGAVEPTIWRLPIKSVGVQGDERSYAHPAVITGPLPLYKGEAGWGYYQSLSPKITNAHKDINRVLLLVSGDKKSLPKATLKKAYLTKKRLDLLRKIDDIADSAILTDKQCQKIWQMPTVLVPFGHKHGESIVLRPVESEEAMTVSFGVIPSPTLKKIIKKIHALNAVDFIFYDLTNKPPGTIEWE